MSSNRLARANHVFWIAMLAASAAACASAPAKPSADVAITPTQQFAIKVTSQPDEICWCPTQMACRRPRSAP